jgi:hypothetical protein
MAHDLLEQNSPAVPKEDYLRGLPPHPFISGAITDNAMRSSPKRQEIVRETVPQ